VEQEVNLDEAKRKYNQAKSEWDEFKIKAKEYRESEILDFHTSVIEGETEEIIKYKKKIIKGIKKTMQRNRMFAYLTNNMGKKVKSRLKLLRVKNIEGRDVKTLYDRREIENSLLKYNKEHFSKAKQSQTYKDRINKRLYNDSIRDKILEGMVDKAEVDSEDLREFLKILKSNRNRTHYNYEPIIEDELLLVIKKSKKRSVFSIFFKRIYTI